MNRLLQFLIGLVIILIIVGLTRIVITKEPTSSSKPKQIILVQINNQNLTMYDGSVEQSPVRINENGEFVMAYMIRLNVPQQPQVPPQPRAEVVPGPEK